MRTIFSIVDQRQKEMYGARPCGTHPGRELAGTLHRPSERVGFLVGRRARRLEQDIGSKLALEKKLRSLARLRHDSGQEVPAGRSLLAALRQLFCQPSEDQQIRLGIGGSHQGLPETVLTRRAAGPTKWARWRQARTQGP